MAYMVQMLHMNPKVRKWVKLTETRHGPAEPHWTVISLNATIRFGINHDLDHGDRNDLHTIANPLKQN